MTEKYIYITKERARKLVLDYLELVDEYIPPIIPKFVNPEQLNRLLRENVQFKSAPDKMWRTFELVGFYGLGEIVEHFWSFLDEKVYGRCEFSSSCSIVNMAAYTGDKKHWKQGHDYYEQVLIKRTEANKNIPLLIRCYTALGPECSSESLRTLCIEKQNRAKMVANSSDENYMELQSINRIINNDLPRAEQAMVMFDKLQKLKRQEQIKQYIMLYTGIDPSYPEHLFRRAAYFLLREAEKGASEKEEITNEMLKVFGSDVQVEKDLQTKKFYQTRLIKAIEYFNAEKVPTDQMDILAEAKASGQDDFISTLQPDYQG